MVSRSPRRRLLGVAVLVGGSGVTAGLAAASGLGPFAAPHHATPPPRLVSAVQPAIRADTLFPAATQPPPTVRVTQVIDPGKVVVLRPSGAVPASAPVTAHDDAPRPPNSPPTPASDGPGTKPTPTPTPTPAMTSSPTPCPDDGCGGD